MKQWLVTVLILVLIAVAISQFSNSGGTSPLALTPVPSGSPQADDSAFRLLSDALQADDQAQAAKATAIVAEETAQVLRAALTSTAQENSDRATRIAVAQTNQAHQAMVAATEAAIGTATQQQFEIIGWTVTAAVARDTQQAQMDGTATSVAATAIERAHQTQAAADAYNQSVIATQTQVALNLLTAQEAAQLQQIEDKKRTDAMISTVRDILGAFAPWVFLVVVVVAAWLGMGKAFDLGGRLIRAWAQAKGIVQWMNGKPFFIHTRDDGSVTYVDMSKNPGPAVTISPDGEVSNPIQAEDAVLQRSAAVEGLLALGTGANRGVNGAQGSRVAANLTGGQPQSNQQHQPFVIYTPEQSKLLPPGIRSSLDNAWQQAVEGEYREDKDTLTDSSQEAVME